MRYAFILQQRQAMICSLERVELERSTLADWVAQLGRLLDSLGQALGRHVLGGATLPADDTPIPEPRGA